MTAVRSYNPVWYFVDLTGVQLDDTYYFFVLSNDFPYNFATVWHDNQMTTPWTQPIQFLANGTLPTDIFFDPNVVYRLEIRHGNTSADTLIYEIDDYTINGNTPTPTPSDIINSENQISNPQFARVDFVGSVTITRSGTWEVGPGWYITLTGAGSTTLTQIPISGKDGTNIGNPPYKLRIANSGWTSAVLFQEFDETASIWSNEAVSVNLLGFGSGSSAVPITINYVNNNNVKQLLANGTVGLSVYTPIQGAVKINPSTNTSSNGSAFIQFQIVLPPTNTVDVTNIQLVAGGLELVTPDPVFLPYNQETVERQDDHLFHYYKLPLLNKPIPSYLVGWDFPLNPAQILGTSIPAQAIGANKSFYAWDQTIIFQSANSGILVNPDSVDYLEIKAAATTQFALIQYVEGERAREILKNRLSMNISATTKTGLNNYVGTVAIFYTTDATLPSLAAGTNNSLVASLGSNGQVTGFNTTGAGGWVAVANDNPQYLQFKVNPSSNLTFNNYGFTGWDMSGNAVINNVTFIAIVVGFSSLAANNIVNFNSISLVPGDVPTIPAPQTQDEVLRECQYFYEKSYDSGTLPGTNTAMNIFARPMSWNTVAGTVYSIASYFDVHYNVNKRTIPTIKFYNSGGSADVVDVIIDGTNLVTISRLTITIAAEATFWTNVIGVKALNAQTKYSGSGVIASIAAGANTVFQATILFHYVVDARLGIVN